MFVGAIPKQLAQQIVGGYRIDAPMFVGCSGSFRLEKAVAAVSDCRIVSNDVSLFSCSIGALAAGVEIDISFTGRLAFLERITRGDFRRKVAAVCFALVASRYKGDNAFARAHFAHMQANADALIEKEAEKLSRFMQGLRVDRFEPGDFLDQVERAKGEGGIFMSFPPTYGGGYERMFRFIEQNTKWASPAFGSWNPDDLPRLLTRLDDERVRHVVASDVRIPGRAPSMMFRGQNKPVYVYTDDGDASLRKALRKTSPFRYVPIDPAAVSAASVVSIITLTGGQADFLKDVYLAKGIDHKRGIANYGVVVDGMLAGAFVFAMNAHGDKLRSIYMLSDFSLSRQRKLSKLIPMLATSRQVINDLNKRYMLGIERITTTAFTDRPVSMKYRGIFELAGRKPGAINYQSPVREACIQDIYADWWRRYGN